MKPIAIIPSVLYIAGILLANTLTSHFGLVPVGFGLMATAGTWAAGLVLAARNGVQEAGGRNWIWLLIIIGAALSWTTSSGRIAMASGVTFLIAEGLDTTVYSTLRKHGWRRAAVAGMSVGAVLDTLLFLTLAGFPVTTGSVFGQLLVKGAWGLAAYFLIAEGVRRAFVSRQSVYAAGA